MREYLNYVNLTDCFFRFKGNAAVLVVAYGGNSGNGWGINVTYWVKIGENRVWIDSFIARPGIMRRELYQLAEENSEYELEITIEVDNRTNDDTKSVLITDEEDEIEKWLRGGLVRKRFQGEVRDDEWEVHDLRRKIESAKKRIVALQEKVKQ